MSICNYLKIDPCKGCQNTTLARPCRVKVVIDYIEACATKEEKKDRVAKLLKKYVNVDKYVVAGVKIAAPEFFDWFNNMLLLR